MKRRDQRIKVMTCIYQYLLTEKSMDDIFDDNLDIDDKKSISFIVENTVNTLKDQDELEEVIKTHLTPTWDYDRLGYIEKAILLMGAEELVHGNTDRAVIINEAVEIAKKYCDDDAPKLINGVLDQI